MVAFARYQRDVRPSEGLRPDYRLGVEWALMPLYVKTLLQAAWMFS